MPDLIADPPTSVYLLLAVVAVGAAFYCFRTQTRRSLLIVVGILLAIGLLVLIDELIESPREEAVRRVEAMAEAATASDPVRFLEHLSPSFRYQGADRERVRVSPAWELIRQHQARVAVWGFGRGSQELEYPTENEIEIGFYAKAQVPTHEGLVRYIKARFARQPDGRYLLTTMRMYTPGLSLKTEDPIPGFP